MRISPKLALATAAAILCSHALAGSCTIGFTSGTAISDSNITNSAGLGADWGDATVIQSGASCLNILWDWDPVNKPVFTSGPDDPIFPGTHAYPFVPRQIRLFSKTDSTKSFLYLAFEVMDGTINRQDSYAGGSTALKLGEQIVLQFDPNGSRGARIGFGGGKDYKIVIRYKRQPATMTSELFESTLPPVDENWLTGSGNLRAGATEITGGYVVELKIPLADVGIPAAANAFGFTFAVVNDLGWCLSATGPCDATGVGDLPIDNFNNVMADSPGDAGVWMEPDTWGTGSFGGAPPDVTISQLDDWWMARSVQVLQCGTTPGYVYYKNPPCKLTVQAKLDYTGTFPQQRNVLYLWGKPDGGQVKWSTIALLPVAVSNPGGNFTTPSLWSPPKNLTDHPCIRVYVLPAALSLPNDQARLASLSDVAESVIQSIQSQYARGSQHWAQKNISIHSTVVECPSSDPQCKVALRFNPGFPLAGVAPLAVMAQPPQTTQPPMTWARAVGTTTQENHVAVQFRTFGYSRFRSGAKPRTFNFIEQIGGAMQLFPLAMIKGDRTLPMTIQITNGDIVERVIALRWDTWVPPAAGKVVVKLDYRPRLFRRAESVSVKGNLVSGKGRPGTCWDRIFGGGATLLLVGLVAVGIAARSVRRNRRA